MNKTIVSVINIISILCFLSFAGDTVSLDEVMKIASERSDGIRLTELRYEGSIYEKNIYRAEALPYVGFEASVAPSGMSMKTTTEGLGIGSEGSGGDTSIVEDPTGNLTDGQEIGVNSIIGQIIGDYMSFDINDYRKGISTDWSLTVSQPLITFGKVRSALRAAKLRAGMLDEVKQLEQDTFYVNVIEKYTAALSAQNDFKIVKKAYESSRHMLDKIELDAEAGFVSKSTKLRIQARYYASEAELAKAETRRENTIQSLNNITGAAMDTTVTLESEECKKDIEYFKGKDASGGLGLRLQNKYLDLTENQVVYERSKLFPSISLFGRVYNQLFYEYDKSYPEFSSIFDKDYVSWLVGLKLSWTIMDGFYTPNNYKKTKNNYEIMKINLEQTEKGLSVAESGARRGLETIEKSIEAVKAQLEASENAYEAAKIDFEDGEIDVTDYLDTEKEYLSAQKSLNDLRMQRLIAVTQLKVLLGIPIYEAVK